MAAGEWKATKRPSAEIAGLSERTFALAPAAPAARLTRSRSPCAAEAAAGTAASARRRRRRQAISHCKVGRVGCARPQRKAGDGEDMSCLMRCT